MLKHLFVAGTLLLVSLSSLAGEERNILQKAFENVDIAPTLVVDQSWVPYPVYSDRAGWGELVGEFSSALINLGEQSLSYRWKDITDDDYLAYTVSGDRNVMEDKLHGNSGTLGRLLIAELVEGEGRFIDDIVRGVDWFCHVRSWAVSAHLAKYQRSKSPLPDPSENILALFQGNISQLLSWTWFFLHDEIDAKSPGLSQRLRDALQKRALDPYLERDDFWWMGFDRSSGKKMNNWNPWCNQNELLCFMLLESDPEVLARAIDKSILSIDKYLDDVAADGACDEGTTYWYKSTGHLLDYLENLERISSGRLAAWDNPFIRNLGEYILNADIADNWQVNFADGTPSRRPISYVIYRFGKASGNDTMTSFAISRYKKNGADPVGQDWTLFYQSLENLLAVRALRKAAPAEYQPHYFVLYPDTKVCFIRAGDAFLGAKGGHNYERHNHNDVGSCVYFYDSKPVLVDAGVGTYNRKTFGAERYSNWFVQSSWHNLPTVNGCDQPFGEQFASGQMKACRLLRYVSTDIADAYPDSAKVKSYKIIYRLNRRGDLKIRHKFSVDSLASRNVLHFLVVNKPVMVSEGKIDLGNGMVMNYDPKAFKASIETKSLVGLGFSSRWGDALYRINLTATRLENKGKYTINIKYEGEETIAQIAERVVKVAKAQYPLMEARLAEGMTPRGINPDGSMKDRNVGSWTSGFFPGNLWYVYMLSPDADVLAMAERQTFRLDSLLSFPQSHDLGFQVNCSYGNAYRVTGDTRYLKMIEEGTRALASRFNPKVGATLSWEMGVKGAYPVIIDNMMNLELLEYSAKLFDCDSLREISKAHAYTTMKNHFREDYSCWHMLDYDPATGEVLRKVTVQGYSDDSAWSRGQAWALYGYSMMYRETGCKDYLVQAEAIAKMILSRLSADGIPFWDFDDPDVPWTYKDSSAAAVMASAFVELSTLTSDRRLSRKYLDMAERQLRSLASEEYLAAVGENGNFLLKHSVGNLPGDAEVDSPLVYADYYFLEALYRYTNL